jgi:exonuclease VII large subunit
MGAADGGDAVTDRNKTKTHETRSARLTIAETARLDMVASVKDMTPSAVMAIAVRRYLDMLDRDHTYQAMAVQHIERERKRLEREALRLAGFHNAPSNVRKLPTADGAS